MPTSIHTLLLFLWFSLVSLCQTATGNDEIVSPETIDGTTIVDAEGLIETVTQIPELILIDSRIIADHKEGFIEGSVNLPDIETDCDSLASTVPRLVTPVLFYCNGIKCGRSAKAAIIAIDCGYSNIYWFRNGMEEWQEQEYPLVQ
ncbi:MAG: rhodanese-like domain-containing protein [Gammaproteobacteria bacterium]|nr:rhodanese-like domain-containing protein [Gammaproteobacteria bacterium]